MEKKRRLEGKKKEKLFWLLAIHHVAANVSQ